MSFGGIAEQRYSLYQESFSWYWNYSRFAGFDWFRRVDDAASGYAAPRTIDSGGKTTLHIGEHLGKDFSARNPFGPRTWVGIFPSQRCI
jgi:hypothetical protein